MFHFNNILCVYYAIVPYFSPSNFIIIFYRVPKLSKLTLCTYLCMFYLHEYYRQSYLKTREAQYLKCIKLISLYFADNNTLFICITLYDI